MSGLTNKQRVFIEEYLTCWNATEAARRAKYRGSDATLGVVGHENLRKPKIAQAIKQRLAAKAMLADEVVGRLADQARSDVAHFIVIDPDTGKAVIDLRKAQQADKLHLIRKLDADKGKIELYSAQNALSLLGKHLGLFIERRELSGPDGGPITFFNLAEWKEKRNNRIVQVTQIDDGETAN